MAKKIAVLVGERQDEALRMGVGLTLADDEVHVYVLDRKVAENENNELNLETMVDMDVSVFTNSSENSDLELLSDDEIAKRLTDYDHVLQY
jgi:hypothetical protein